MKQIRFQPLNNTYQQLSTLLCATALSIPTTDYTAPADWARLVEQVKKTYATFKAHAEREENILFPLLHNYEPALVAILRDEQCECMRYLKDLNNLLATCLVATDKDKSRLFSHKLLYRMDEFVATTLQHLKEHESMINAVLWRYYSDKELVQIAASLSVAQVTLLRKDFTFADNLIKNIAPVTTSETKHKRTRNNKVHPQHRTSTKLAIAI